MIKCAGGDYAHRVYLDWILVLCFSVTVGSAVQKPSPARNKVLAESGFSLDPEDVPIFHNSGQQEDHFTGLHQIQLAAMQEPIWTNRGALDRGIFARSNNPPILVHGTVGKYFLVSDGQVPAHFSIVGNYCRNPSRGSSVVLHPKFRYQFISRPGVGMYMKSGPLDSEKRVRARFCSLCAQVRGTGAILRGAYRFSGFFQSIAYVVRLPVHRPVVFLQSSPLPVSEPRDDDRSYSRENDAPDSPPFGRRVALLWGSTVLLLPFCYFGGKFIDRHRKRLGNLLVFVGFVLFSCGLCLIVLTCFRWSWGWWL
jgi:hypothetical protein